ncbi:MAG TPA: hypothetical protein VN081_02760, partial [Dongiaceae bacterium]|nr:hypothetical protein [Dongiaceae bacterium]
SLRNFKDGEITYFTASGKELPFVPEFKTHTIESMKEADTLVQKSTKPVVVIDDTNFLWAKDYKRGKDKNPKNSFAIFNEMKDDFFTLLENITKKKTDQNIYVMAHLDADIEGVSRMKTAGKATSEGLTPPEGFTNIVLKASVDIGEFVFEVKSDGTGIKSPVFGDKPMFDGDTVPNDLKEVDKQIRAYFAPKKGTKK